MSAICIALVLNLEGGVERDVEAGYLRNTIYRGSPWPNSLRYRRVYTGSVTIRLWVESMPRCHIIGDKKVWTWQFVHGKNAFPSFQTNQKGLRLPCFRCQSL